MPNTHDIIGCVSCLFLKMGIRMMWVQAEPDS